MRLQLLQQDNDEFSETYEIGEERCFLCRMFIVLSVVVLNFFII